MTTAFIALGANLDDPAAQVRAGFEAIARLPETTLTQQSSLYRSAPVGEVTDQPDFINAVCAVKTALAPEALLQALHNIESRAGRARGADVAPGGPRTLDLDLLLYGDLVLQTPPLTLPHPRLHERAFVLYPLAEIAPGLVVPGRGPVDALAARCAGQRIVKL